MLHIFLATLLFSLNKWTDNNSKKIFWNSLHAHATRQQCPRWPFNPLTVTPCVSTANPQTLVLYLRSFTRFSSTHTVRTVNKSRSVSPATSVPDRTGPYRTGPDRHTTWTQTGNKNEFCIWFRNATWTKTTNAVQTRGALGESEWRGRGVRRGTGGGQTILIN